MDISFLSPEIAALTKRGLTEDTCRKWGYGTATYKGDACQVAQYRNKDGELIAQKLRFKDKAFKVIGDGKNLPLFGIHLWRSAGRQVVVTEGEIDALSVSQAMDHAWPVVSIPTGAKGAVHAIRQNIEWLEAFDTVVFCFDIDEPGRNAAMECAALLTPGKAKIAELPLKDPNEMLLARKTKELVNAIWQARECRPDGIVTIADLRDQLNKPVEWGLPWPWATLTNATYGRRYGEVYTFGAGTGVGKTDIVTAIVTQTAYDLQQPCGLFFLEQSPTETLRRVAGKMAGKLFHIPDAGWTQESLDWVVGEMTSHNHLLHLYNHFGSTEWAIIKSRIKYLAHAHGVKHFFIDHLTALSSHAEDERRFLDGFMEEAASLAQQLNACFYLISHLSTPEGTPHEEGGRVKENQFTGSRAIQRWSFFMFGLERNKQAEDEFERNCTTFRILKDRYTGQSAGLTFKLHYDRETGLLYEVDAREEPEINPFKEKDDF